MSDTKANIDSYIERLEKPAGVPPFIQREVAMIMRHQQAEIERLTAERDHWKEECSESLDEIERLKADPGLFATGDRSILEQNQKYKAEIDRLNKRHDDFLQEFWATNAENAKLQAVVDAAKRNGYATDELIKALAALKEADDE